MSVGSPQEWGAKGYQVLVAKYGEHQVNLWRKRGGRKKELTYSQLMKAVTGPTARATKTAEGSAPSATTQQNAGGSER